MEPSSPPPTINLLPAPRRAVVDYLKERGPSRAEEISRDLEITISGIRQHLASLGAEGLVTFDVHRGSPGRPKHFFRLTRHGENLFHKEYLGFAIEAVTFLQQRAPGLLQDLLREHLAHRYQGIHARSGQLTFAEQVEALAADLDAAGFMSSVERDGSNYRLVLRNCPLLEVARCAPEFCELEATEIARATGVSNAPMEAHQIDGDNHCVYVLEAPTGGDQ